MELMRSFPDKYFDLCVIDPPYGIGVDGNKEQRWKDGSLKRKAHEIKGWDANIPTKEYWEQLFRVSKNQIVFGGNYFTEFLPPTKAWIFWYKGQQDLTMSDGEMAWTSFNKVTRMVDIHRTHIWQEKPIHPTQKPVKLYDWIFKNYLPNGGKVLDTHGGSMSSVISAIKAGNIEMTCSELDKDYFKAAKERILTFQSQLDMFAPPADIIFHE
jgi:site-specific DNA-methyltransferase (adenine-specific)